MKCVKCLEDRKDNEFNKREWGMVCIHCIKKYIKLKDVIIMR